MAVLQNRRSVAWQSLAGHQFSSSADAGSIPQRRAMVCPADSRPAPAAALAQQQSCGAAPHWPSFCSSPCCLGAGPVPQRCGGVGGAAALGAAPHGQAPSAGAHLQVWRMFASLEGFFGCLPCLPSSVCGQALTPSKSEKKRDLLRWFCAWLAWCLAS